MQQWFSFSDRQMEDVFLEIEGVCHITSFGGITDTYIYAEDTIFNFRNFLADDGFIAILVDNRPT